MRSFTRPRRLGLFGALLFLAALAPVLSQPAQTTISFRIIVLDSQDAAERILSRLRNGENFVALATEVSEDPSASNGGLVGPLPVSDLRPQIRTVLDALHTGELSGVIPLPTGFGILKLVPTTDAGRDRKSTRLNSSHRSLTRMPSSA